MYECYHNHCLQMCRSKCLISWTIFKLKSKKNVNTLKRKYDENIKWKSIYQNNKNTVDDLDNVESATDDAATKENLLETCKKIFWVVNFCFY